MSYTETPLAEEIKIGTRFRIWYEVQNLGPDTVDVIVRTRSTDLTFSMEERWMAPARNTHGHMYWNGICHQESYTKCEMTLKPNESGGVMGSYTAQFPGTFETSLSVESSSATDPAPENNEPIFDSVDVSCTTNGSDENDELRGTPDWDSICGWGGDDVLIPELGKDNHNGFDPEDLESIHGDGGGDVLIGGSGDDVFKADRLSQIYIGGPGHDVVDYSDSTWPVKVSLEDQYACGQMIGCDRLVDIEEVIGTPEDDYLGGTSAQELLVARGGNDRIVGRGGRDDLLGGSGHDRFISDDRRDDVVEGGRGWDRASLDPGDSRSSVRRRKDRPFEEIKVGPR